MNPKKELLWGLWVQYNSDGLFKAWRGSALGLDTPARIEAWG